MGLVKYVDDKIVRREVYEFIEWQRVCFKLSLDIARCLLTG